jgi:hypothetical protein
MKCQEVESLLVLFSENAVCAILYACIFIRFLQLKVPRQKHCWWLKSMYLDS